MRRLRLRESQVQESVSIPHDVATSIAALGIANVAPLGNGRWAISDVSKVGVIQIAGWQVAILPKVPVARLFFLMSFSSDQKFWQDHDVEVGEWKDLLDTITHSFIRQAGIAVGREVLQSYRTVDEAVPMIRGRLDIPAQIGRRAGLAFPAQVIFDEYTADIAENQLLLSAARRLLALPSLGASNRSAIVRLTQRLEGVRTLPPGSPLPKVHFNRLNDRYRGAVGLSRLILSSASIEQRQGAVVASGFLFDTWRIFEDFVSKALQVSLLKHGQEVDLQSSAYLDQGRELSIKPDILVRSSGSVTAALDAKYKAQKNGRFPPADVYQMLAYCLRFRLTEGHLVYAKGVGGKRYVIDPPGVVIHCHTLNLDQEPFQLLADVDLLATRIARSLHKKNEG